MAIQRRYDIKNLVRELAENKVRVLELIREALSNAKDHAATKVWIKTLQEKQSNKVSVLLADNGEGMDDERLAAFWGVGASAKRDHQYSIGYKGHGTKLYFKCRRLSVATRTSADQPWRVTRLDSPSEYDREEIPETSLADGEPLATEIAVIGLSDHHGTVIHIEQVDFEDHQDLLQRIEIESYCDWFTVLGDIRSGLFDKRVEFHRALVDRAPILEELRLHEGDLRPIEVNLCINGEKSYLPIGRGRRRNEKEFFAAWHEDQEEFANNPGLIPFGHRFANSFDGSTAGKRLRDDRSALRLTGPGDWATPGQIAIVARVEGHRRQLETYREAQWQGHRGIYGFEQRFGLWLCRDFIPVAQRNDLLREALDSAFESEVQYGFGNLRNWKVFVNLQNFRLTANRNEVSKQKSLEVQVRDALESVIVRARKHKSFRDWIRRLKSARTERKKNREIAQIDQRLEAIEKWIRKSPKPDGIDPIDVEGLTELGRDHSLLLKEPRSEQELFYVYGLLSGRFEMPIHIIGYNASEGVDAIGKLRVPTLIASRRPHVRVEFKLEVAANNPIHHFFDAIDVIVCWRVGKGGDIYEETSAGIGKLRKRKSYSLSPAIDTYEIEYDSEDGEKRVIPVVELSALFPSSKRKKTSRK